MNCRQDFSDLDNGWVDASGSMINVVEVLERKYPKDASVYSWFGHPARLTIEGHDLKESEQ